MQCERITRIFSTIRHLSINRMLVHACSHSKPRVYLIVRHLLCFFLLQLYCHKMIALHWAIAIRCLLSVVYLLHAPIQFSPTAMSGQHLGWLTLNIHNNDIIIHIWKAKFDFLVLFFLHFFRRQSKLPVLKLNNTEIEEIERCLHVYMTDGYDGWWPYICCLSGSHVCSKIETWYLWWVIGLFSIHPQWYASVSSKHRQNMSQSPPPKSFVIWDWSAIGCFTLAMSINFTY